MKNLFLLLLLVLVTSCSNDSEAEQETQELSNKILMLQVDFTSNTFEGGKEYEFNTSEEDFTISTDYMPPGDFGNIKLYYEELNEMLFDGSIIWMGDGVRAFPESLNAPDTYQVNTNPVTMPSINDFGTVDYTEYSYYPEQIDYSSIWNAIANLQVVTEFRNSNPNGEIQLFLYTPSVGVVDYEQADWIIFLKN